MHHGIIGQLYGPEVNFMIMFLSNISIGGPVAPNALINKKWAKNV